MFVPRDLDISDLLLVIYIWRNLTLNGVDLYVMHATIWNWPQSCFAEDYMPQSKTTDSTQFKTW